MPHDDGASTETEPPRGREAFSSAMADAVPILIAYVDREERYRFVNRAYERWFGIDRSQIEGRTLNEVLGEVAYGRLRAHVSRALAGETLTFEGEIDYQGAGPRHIEASYVPDIAPDGAVLGYYVLVADISARKAVEQELARLLDSERRRAGLLELGRQLREETDPLSAADRACELVARQLGAPRAGYAEVQPDGLMALHIGEWIEPDMPSLAGSLRELDGFGPGMAAQLRAGGQVIISDVTRDPLTNTDPAFLAAYEALRIRSFVTAPLIKGPRMAAYIYVAQDVARAWTADESAFVADVAELVWIAVERARSDAALKRAEDTERLLIREVDHRAKNVLAVVQSLAQLTPFVDKRQYVEALSGRIGSLARSHSLLSTSRWTGVRLDALLHQELEPYGAGSDDRVLLSGPPVLIQAQAAQSLGLVLHELATNASKYGALADVTGALSVSWAWDAARRLILIWREASAQVVSPPSHKGFGSTLITQAAKQLGARIEQDWRPEGLTCRLTIAKGALPCEAETVFPSPAAPGPAPDGGQTLRDQRVLVVEDEALVAMDLARVLAQAGAQVVGPAGSIEEALDLIASMEIDRAVLDVNLGGRIVTPVAQALSARAIPFVYLTGYQEPGVSDGPVLRKPAAAELLLSALGG
ncbi:PAS domain-containing protein [Caulobacter sp.]|uniref:PAS domain-containing protein n=1 Tax=Caulobacter sp. TaxID=78 RepID=UPI003BAA7C13